MIKRDNWLKKYIDLKNGPNSISHCFWPWKRVLNDKQTFPLSRSSTWHLTEASVKSRPADRRVWLPRFISYFCVTATAVAVTLWKNGLLLLPLGPVLLLEGNERQSAWSEVGTSAGVYGRCVVSHANMISAFRALCFSTRLLIETTKAITMTLLAKQPSSDPRLALVKDVQQAVRATLEFKMGPETVCVSQKQLVELSWANAHSQTLLSSSYEALVLFVLLKVTQTTSFTHNNSK